LIEHELREFLQKDNAGAALATKTGYPRLSRLSRAFPVAPMVEIQPDEGSKHWRLAIVASDRPGLLADVARVFVQFNVSVLTAKVMTLGERVEDVFVISGEDLNQPRKQRQFERAVSDALSQEVAHAA
jgi:[protein-PII] uridylyltransferase